MRISALCTAVLTCVVAGHPLPVTAQVDRQRAEEYFKEAQALCERDAGRLWGVSICAPMVIGDARTGTFATSEPPPDAARPQLIGVINGPIKWGDRMWAALTWTRFPTGRLAHAARRSFTNRFTSSSRDSYRTDRRVRTNIWIPSRDGIGCAWNGARSRGRSGNQARCVLRPFARPWPSARLVMRDIPTRSKANARFTSLKASPRIPRRCWPRHPGTMRSRARASC